MSLDPRFIAAVDLSGYLVNKRTGKAITNGEIEFWVDNQRNTPKLVYKLSGQAPNYTFEELPNPVRIVNGTAVDETGTNVAIYYFPYDSFDDDAAVQLYYVVVRDLDFIFSSSSEFTREAWPPMSGESGSSVVKAQNAFANMLSNSQFVDIIFAPQTAWLNRFSSPSNASPSYTLTFSGSGTNRQRIAPDWWLLISYTGSCSVMIERLPISGDSTLPGNPPYVLQVTPSGGANISSLIIEQMLFDNPDIWSPDANLSNGYVSSSILLDQGTSITMNYVPNNGTLQELLSQTNNTGGYAQFTNVVQLIAPDNSSAPPPGQVDIQLVLSKTSVSTFGNVQIVPLEENIADVPYQQQPVNYQKDHLAHYYVPILQTKPTSSYLTGWNFPLNPAQFAGDNVGPIATGANGSFYAWDQTIVFQSVDSGTSVSRSSTGALVITAASDTQFALVQYVPQAVAREMLNYEICMNISAVTNQSTGISCSSSIWYTTSGSLPSISGSNQSIVASLNTDGSVGAKNGSWTIVSTKQGTPTFTLQERFGFSTTFLEYGLDCWELPLPSSGQTTATFVAVVVGFGVLNSGNTVSIEAISLLPGRSPCRPSVKTAAQELQDCQQYYYKTFLPGTIPAQNVGMNTGEYQTSATRIGNNPNWLGTFYFPAFMNSIPSITFYNPVATNALIRDFSTPANFTSSAPANITQRSFNITGNGNASTNNGDEVGVHFTADARLGA